MKILFSLTPADSEETHLVSAQFRPHWFKIRWLTMILIAFLIFGGTSFLLWQNIKKAGALEKGSVPDLFAFLIEVLMILVIGWTGLRRGIFRKPSHRGEQQVTIDHVGISIRGTRGTAKVVPWHRIADYRESENLILLYSSWFSGGSSIFAYKYPPGFLYVLPKRAFNGSQLAEFHLLAQSHVPQKKYFGHELRAAQTR